MANINSFFPKKNIAQKLTEADTNQTANYLETIRAFARTTYNSVYVIDYKEQAFEYVSENPLFLCGNTAQEVKEMGYGFYFKYVPEKEIELLLKINAIGFAFFEKTPIKERKKYTISYDFHLTTNEDKLILINQKLTPLFLTEDGKIWKAICVVSLSSEQKAGNITVRKNSGDELFTYDLNGNYWRTIQQIKLSDREAEILRFSISGYNINEIAEKIFVSPDTVKFQRKNMFLKMDVSNISEAINYATINKLL